MMSSHTVVQSLRKFTTCDVADALIKVGHRGGGFLPGIHMWSPTRQAGPFETIVGPAYTVKFTRKTDASAPVLPTHYIDTVPPGSVVFISAPAGLRQVAVYGGLMSTRAKALGAVGTVVDGNFRDLQQHRNLGLPVFGRGAASPSFYEVVRASEVNIPVVLQDAELEVVIQPGDYIVGDVDGVVRVPRDLAGEVLKILPKIVDADERMAVHIANGMSFVDARIKERGQ